MSILNKLISLLDSSINDSIYKDAVEEQTPATNMLPELSSTESNNAAIDDDSGNADTAMENEKDLTSAAESQSKFDPIEPETQESASLSAPDDAVDSDVGTPVQDELAEPEPMESGEDPVSASVEDEPPNEPIGEKEEQTVEHETSESLEEEEKPSEPVAAHDSTEVSQEGDAATETSQDTDVANLLKDIDAFCHAAQGIPSTSAEDKEELPQSMETEESGEVISLAQYLYIR